MIGGPSVTTTTVSVAAGSATVELAVDTWGEGEPVLVLHGFTGSAQAMEALSMRLDHHALVVPDLVGHGRSSVPTDLDTYSVPAMATQVIGVADGLGLGTIHLVGYSMGARVALTLACTEPQRLRTLNLIGASPGLADPEDRARRQRADAARADRIERDLAAFVDEWMAEPLFAGQARLGPEFLAAARIQRLRSDPRGLANSLRAAGTGSMPPLFDRLEACPTPTQLVVGAEDAKFAALAVEMVQLLPDGRVTPIVGAGHAAHLEQPEATAAAIVEFIDARR